MDQHNKRFKTQAGVTLVEVRVKDPMQLFDARDPAPFRARDLDEDFEEYIISSVKELHRSTPFKIEILVGKPEASDLSSAVIVESISSYFSYREERKAQELKSFLRRSQLYFAIGAAILVLCIGIAQWMHGLAPSPAIAIFREGVVIFGWVSLWKPIELILFDWIPLYESLRLLRRIRNCEINVSYGHG